jgi:hypothetical protein
VDIEFGNAGEMETRGTGWFIGFSDWTKLGTSGAAPRAAERRAHGLCVKWYAHAQRSPHGESKPVSEGRSISMLVGPDGEFRIELAPTADFDPAETVVHVLRRPGDFAAWARASITGPTAANGR